MSGLSVPLYKKTATSRVAEEQAVLVTARCHRPCEILRWLRALSFLAGAGISADTAARPACSPLSLMAMSSAGFGEQKCWGGLEKKRAMN